MADSAGPFGAAPWSQTEWHNFAPTWAPSGVVGTPAALMGAGDFAVTSSGLNVTVACNGDRAWIDGSGFNPDSDKVLAVAANANASLSRRDRLVIRRDLAAGTITVAHKEGTPAGTPTAPSLTQTTGGVYELPICSFLVPPNNGTTLTTFIDERVWVDPGGQGVLIPRFKTYERGVDPPTDQYSSGNGFLSLIDNAWAAAPAGDYLLHTTLAIAGSVAMGGNLEVWANGTMISQPNHRADIGTFVTTISNVHPFTHAGGALPFTVKHAVTGAGTATIYNASSKAVLQYLGRRT